MSANTQHIFKMTWAWGGSKTFPDKASMVRWRGEHEDEIAGMFPPREYVLGADDNWHELANDCHECGAST